MPFNLPSSVTIIGASLSGLYTAYHLARRGIPVKIYEAQTSFKPSSRTLIVTPMFLRLMDFDIREAVLNYIDRFELISKFASTQISLAEPDLVIERSRLMTLLLHRACKAGAELFLDHCLEKIEGHHLYFTSAGRCQKILSSLVIGADGVDSQVAKIVSQKRYPQLTLLQQEVFLPSDYPSNLVRIWFDRQTTRFFFWLIPESKQTGVLGIITENFSEAREALERFLVEQRLVRGKRQEEGKTPFPSFLGNSWKKGGFLLIGDAAAQVKATTMGGVVFGLQGALAVIESLTNPTTSYRKTTRQLRRELLLHLSVRRLLDTFGDQDYDDLLSSLNSKVLKVLHHYNRDELCSAFFRLLLFQPKWVLWLAKALWKSWKTHRKK